MSMRMQHRVFDEESSAWTTRVRDYVDYVNIVVIYIKFFCLIWYSFYKFEDKWVFYQWYLDLPFI